MAPGCRHQVSPRSFADANGDGTDAVWLSPFYPSALADGGYDVEDHSDVDPRPGTLAEFDVLISALHTAGLRLVVDIVANHSSDRHPWFRAALAGGPGSPERDRYVFRRGQGGEPPTDWVASFGGSA